MSEEMILDENNSVEVVISGGPNKGKTMMCGDVYFVDGKARLLAGQFAEAKMRILRKYYQVKYAHEVGAEEVTEAKLPPEETESAPPRTSRAKKAE